MSYILYIVVAYYLHSLSRLNVSNLPVMLPFAIGTILLLVLALAAS